MLVLDRKDNESFISGSSGVKRLSAILPRYVLTYVIRHMPSAECVMSSCNSIWQNPL